MNWNWSNQKPNSALKTKLGNMLQKVSVEAFYKNFSKLNEATPENDFDDTDLENLSDYNTELYAPITVEEIFKVILNLKVIEKQ